MIVATARTAADILAPLLDHRATESLAAALLDGEGNLLAVEEEAAGSETEIRLPVRSLVFAALRVQAQAIILGHNHPSGDPRPSPADIAATRNFAAVARALDLVVQDHLIFARGRCCSLRQMGLL